MPRERYDYAIGEDENFSHERLISVKMWRNGAGKWFLRDLYYGLLCFDSKTLFVYTRSTFFNCICGFTV
jgi:hypothetical protein